MIINKTIFVKSSKFYDGLGYNIEDRYIEIKIEDLPLGSHYIINAKCYYCNYVRTISYKEYNRNISHNGHFSCSNKCSDLKRKETMLNRYYVEHYSKTDEYKERFRKTNLERYGVEHSMMSDIIKNKLKESIQNKYGVENIFQHEPTKNKIKSTNFERYGVENPMYSDFFKNKIQLSNFKKYEVNNYTKSEYHHSKTLLGNDINYIRYLGNNISLFNCDREEHTFEINQLNYHSRNKYKIPLCTICNPIGYSKSIKEKELLEFIKFFYTGKIISSYRDGLEIDIYLPELKIGFEFNGLYWHSEKFKDRNYHLDKTKHFKEKGIKIIHIWEDDFYLRRNIIESQIKKLLKFNTVNIFASKCFVKEVNIKDCKKFLNDNHIQGSVSSQIKIGLYTEDKLVSLMTFNNSEGRKKMEEGGYNLNRFCNKLNTNVVGGASKLLSFFKKKYNPNRIVSYTYKDWSIENLYEVLGFINVGVNGPDYKYIINNERVHKSRYKLKIKLTEVKQMKKNVFLKIYDCGKIKFEYIKI